MDLNEIKLSRQEYIKAATIGFFKGLIKFKMLWFVVWQVAVGRLYLPIMHSQLYNEPSKYDIYLNAVIAFFASVFTGLICYLIFMATYALTEYIKDHFKRHIQIEVDTYKKNIVEKVDDHLVGKQ